MTSVGQLLVGFPELLCEDKVISFSVSLASSAMKEPLPQRVAVRIP